MVPLVHALPPAKLILVIRWIISTLMLAIATYLATFRSFIYSFPLPPLNLFFWLPTIRHCRFNMHSTPRRLSIFFKCVFTNVQYLYIYIDLFIHYYFVRGWRQFAFIHRGCINACIVRAHRRDGALMALHAVYCYTHNICVMAHYVVTCRVWLYTQHLCNGACRYMPCMAIHSTFRALMAPKISIFLFWVYLYIYIYIYFRVMAHAVACRVLLYTQHLCNGACRNMPCIAMHTTFV